jgi:hypothetical protein
LHEEDDRDCRAAFERIDVRRFSRTNSILMSTSPNHRTQAEYYIRGLTQGFVTAADVIAWADEVIVASAKTEDWMLDISTASPDDRMGVLHHLHAVQGQLDETALAALLNQKKV